MPEEGEGFWQVDIPEDVPDDIPHASQPASPGISRLLLMGRGIIDNEAPNTRLDYMTS